MTAAEIQTRIDALEARLQKYAGVTQQTFGDQSSSFSVDQMHKELARLRALLVTVSSGSTTRYASTSKGV